jgi:putative ABC transport system ATP-binding protein
MLLFETQTLGKHYRTGSRTLTKALEEVSLHIEQGSIAVVAGPSGSGKTTLLAILGALERPTQGSVRFAGNDLGSCSGVELARVRRRMGFVFQDFALIPHLTAEENISYPLIPRRVARAERRRRSQDLLARFGMGSKLGVRAGDLSTGEQQRVAIARALAGNPEVVLADEPTASLDAKMGETLLSTFQELHRTGKTLVLASHDSRVLNLATQVYELKGGRLLGPSRERS